jgi:hypothetical protein
MLGELSQGRVSHRHSPEAQVALHGAVGGREHSNKRYPGLNACIEGRNTRAYEGDARMVALWCV